MALLTSQRNTPFMVDRERIAYPVEANTKIYLGAMVAIDDNGYAVAAQPKTGSAPLTNQPQVVGRADMMHNAAYPGQDADNTGGAAGAIYVIVRKEVAKYDNDGTITQAKLGLQAFASDDHTLTATDNSAVNPVAGEIVQIDSDGVWVDFLKQTSRTT
jgi:hypothetical protein